HPLPNPPPSRGKENIPQFLLMVTFFVSVPPCLDLTVNSTQLSDPPSFAKTQKRRLSLPLIRNSAPFLETTSLQASGLSGSTSVLASGISTIMILQVALSDFAQQRQTHFFSYSLPAFCHRGAAARSRHGADPKGPVKT
ncbi:MAG: hypothetical protein WBC70_15325, partial [Candidatus Aminicenantales bacterium]